MGMFDWVTVEAPLPDGWNAGECQSKTLDCTMASLQITAEGRLLCDGKDTNFHGDFNFYGDEPTGPKKWRPIGSDGYGYWKRDTIWHEYTARFTDGQLVSIRSETEDERENRPAKSENSEGRPLKSG